MTPEAKEIIKGAKVTKSDALKLSRLTPDQQTEAATPSPAGIPLADIRDVSVDPKLPKEERIAEFLRQIKNPYCFKCGKFTVRAQFADNGVSLEDCLKQILI